MFKSLLLLAAGVAASSQAIAAQPPVAAVPGQVASRILAVHNRERQQVGHAPLTWDPTRAAAAASYAPVLARLHQLVHSPRESRPGQRENLAMAAHGSMSPEQMVGLWVSEKRFIRAGLFPAVSATGNWEDVAHFTQMVWPTTTHVGCALYEADWDYLVCRYSPPGNIDGRPVFGSRPDFTNRRVLRAR